MRTLALYGLAALVGMVGAAVAQENGPGKSTPTMPCSSDSLVTDSNSAQHTLYTFRGIAPDGRPGHAVSRAGDMDRDGHADILVARPRLDDPSRPGLVQIFSGRNGQVLRTFHGDRAGDGFGAAVSHAGDVNRDGYPDVLVGAPCDALAATDPGYVRLYSGRDGSILFTAAGSVPGDRFGWSVGSAGDVNRDGVPDLLVGALTGGGAREGTVTVFSGRDGNILHLWHGETGYDYFGYALSSAGDLNGDGHADVLVGAPEITSLRDTGYVRVISGRDGGTLFTCCDGYGPGFGTSVSSLGDLDGDGCPEFVVGCPSWKTTTGDVGQINVYRGQTGHLWYTCHGNSSSFGQTVDRIGDVNGDAIPDVVVGEPSNPMKGLWTGSVSVWSGNEGGHLCDLFGDQPGDGFGRCACSLGDVNRDGFPDLAGGALPRCSTTPGYVRILSGTRLPLAASTHQISIRARGSQVFTLQATADHALEFYCVLGSLSGTRPGFRLASRTVPLNPDPYFAFAVNHPDVRPLSRAQGWLDRSSGAQAAFLLPAGLPAEAAGLTLHHAYVLPGAAPLFVSNAVPLTLVP